MYTGLSCPKLMEQLNGNIHYQMFCDVIIDSTRPLANYKLLDDIMLELAGKLKIQQQQDILAEMWKSYMQNLDTMYTDSTCHESEMRYPTDPKLLWEGIEKSYETMCEFSKRLGIHRPRTKFLDVQKANLAYKKQRKHSKSQTKRMTRRLIELHGKILKEIQQKNHFQSRDSRESIPDRIVSINKPYVRPIVRGKEVKSVEFGASPLIHKRLFGVDVKKIGGDTGYAGTENRNLHPFSSSSVSIQPT